MAWKGIGKPAHYRPSMNSGPGASLPYTGNEDADATDAERRIPAGRLTWASGTLPDGRTIVATFYGHENLPDRVVFRVTATDPDRRDRQINPSEVGRPIIERMIAEGNARIGLRTHNHCRPVLFVWDRFLDWTFVCQPRFLEPGSAPAERRSRLADAAWAAPSMAHDKRGLR